jgi:leucyl-tRNA synthetase
MAYDFAALESKWRKRWSDAGLHHTPAKPVKKFYILEEPPQADNKIPLWQFRCFTIGDSVARFKRMQGYDVLHPMGIVSFNGAWDQFAPRFKVPLHEEISNRVKHLEAALARMGFSHDDETLVRSSDPAYYRWTQWLFLFLLHRDLLDSGPEVFFECPVDGRIVPEQCPGRKCMHCGNVVAEKRIEDLWYLKWKPFGERLRKGLERLTSWDAQVRRMQEVWIDHPHPIQSWALSRQRYWGCPIPTVACPKCGIRPVPESKLPVRLPLDVASFEPKGRSVLADHPTFSKTECPDCKGPARRNLDTLPAYFDAILLPFRLCDPKNDREPWDAQGMKAWGPVDLYIGAPDVHLLQLRLVTKALSDSGLVPFDEPIVRMFVPGPVPDISGCTGRYSRGRVVPAEELTDEWGVDACRLAMLMSCPSASEYKWSEESLRTGARLAQRILHVFQKCSGLSLKPGGDCSGYVELRRKARLAAARMEEACEGSFAFHKSISAVIELCNALSSETPAPRTDAERRALGEVLQTVCKVIAPMAPFLGDELWELLGGQESVFLSRWPEFLPEELKDQRIELVVQVNGKRRGKLIVSPGTSEAEVRSRALELVSLKEGKPKKVIFVPDKIINLVV